MNAISIASPERRQKIEARFWKKVDRRGADECWPFIGCTLPSGYGHTYATLDGITLHGAHRVAFALVKGDIPPGQLVCHTCDNPPCCNPAHLWLGRHSDNTRDMLTKGRENPPKGERSGGAKLTDAQAAAMRETLAECDREFADTIAGEFGVSVDAARKIVAGERRIHRLCVLHRSQSLVRLARESGASLNVVRGIALGKTYRV